MKKTALPRYVIARKNVVIKSKENTSKNKNEHYFKTYIFNEIKK